MSEPRNRYIISRSMAACSKERVKSQRWQGSEECKRLGWVMVPATASVAIAAAVTKTFDKMANSLVVKKIPVHESLLDLIERLESSIIEQVITLADGWRRTRIDRWQVDGVDIVTNAVALKAVIEVLEEQFSELDALINKHRLVDIAPNKNDKLVLLELYLIETSVTKDITKIVKGWK
jgi:hypothetical protein